MLEKFVCVRLVKANGLDLSLFQFDYDLTFAVFFMNADKTIYGRYGSRSSVEQATRDISIKGLAASMRAALELHRDYPANRNLLTGKQPVESEYQSADDLPSLRGKYRADLDYPGAVTKSCMHCHQVRDAQRQIYRDVGEPIPDRLLFPNPLPGVVGLQFDPATVATVRSVEGGSAADAAGLRVGDQLLTLQGQTILSLADIQWVFDGAPASGKLRAEIARAGQRQHLDIALAPGWRRNTDISWRVTSWPLRRMVTGGLLLEAATAEQRGIAGVDERGLALFVKHVGQYGAHAAAKKAGFRKGDLIVSFDGQRTQMSPSQVLAYGAQRTRPGQSIHVEVFRDGKRLTLSLPMQK